VNCNKAINACCWSNLQWGVQQKVNRRNNEAMRARHYYTVDLPIQTYTEPWISVDIRILFTVYSVCVYRWRGWTTARFLWRTKIVASLMTRGSPLSGHWSVTGTCRYVTSDVLTTAATGVQSTRVQSAANSSHLTSLVRITRSTLTNAQCTTDPQQIEPIEFEHKRHATLSENCKIYRLPYLFWTFKTFYTFDEKTRFITLFKFLFGTFWKSRDFY